MAELTPLTPADASAQLDELVAAATPDAEKSTLAAAHDLLRAVSGTTDAEPTQLLEAAAAYAGRADEAAVESLAPRIRVAMRLLRANALSAAWVVIVDNATGFVPRSFRGSTSSGADRTEWPLPLLTSVEPPNVFADLPGFRDPRYGLADGLFEIGSAMKLRCHVDEVAAGRRPVLAGWAALDVLTTDPDEEVAVIAAQGGTEVRWPGVRRRRADLAGGNRDTIRRRAWAGWTAECRPEELGEGTGRWSLSVEVSHRGLVRRARIGKSVGELAAAAVGRQLSDRPATRLLAGQGGWAIGKG
jgi:hypothetical protein